MAYTLDNVIVEVLDICVVAARKSQSHPSMREIALQSAGNIVGIEVSAVCIRTAITST